MVTLVMAVTRLTSLQRVSVVCQALSKVLHKHILICTLFTQLNETLIFVLVWFPWSTDIDTKTQKGQETYSKTHNNYMKELELASK